MSAISNEEASLVFSADNKVIGRFFSQNRTNIRWEDVPDHLKNALTSTEDKRFFTRTGFDIRSLTRVFFRSVLVGDKSGGGGSTLSQQLVKNLYGRKYSGFLSLVVNKIKEIIIAARFEEVYTKKQIMLLYLNSVPFGEDTYGVESAAHRFFNKSTPDLKIEESAVLVGMLKANTFFNPRLNPANSLIRRNTVISLMEQEHYITSRTADSLEKLPLVLNYENVRLSPPAGYFVYQVRKQAAEILDSVKAKTGKDYDPEKDGLRIYTTLDMSLQELAKEAVITHLSVMQKELDQELENRAIKKHWYVEQKLLNHDPEKDLQVRQVELFDWGGIQIKKISRLDSLWHYYKMLNASVLIINPKNGSVLSWIGGNDFRILPFDMVLSHRQIASAFKPFLYATAFDRGFVPCMYLANEEKIYSGYEDWEPQNYDRSSTPGSDIALWYALTHSMNLPTVDLYFKVGGEYLRNTCEKLKFPRITGNAPSIALGTLDLSLYEAVRAYAAFADNGLMKDLVMIKQIVDNKGKILFSARDTKPKFVFSQETSQTITAVLQQVINQGTGVNLRNKYGIQAELAGKTGTAQNFSDAWFFAYTPDIVMGTWVGARTSNVHFYSNKGSGASLALPVIADVLKGIENDNDLSQKYLTPFEIPGDIYSFLECNPYRENGIKGFFNRLFKGNINEGQTIQESIKKEKKGRGLKSFFNKLFKGDK